MKIKIPRILGATLTMIFLSGLVQTAQCAKETETGTATLKEPTTINRVYLLNGDRISGTVVSLNKDVLFIECVLSKKLRIDMRAVMAVDFQPKVQQKFQPRQEEMDTIEFVNRDKITGDVLSLSGKTITIKGEYGELVLKKEGLSHIVFGLRERLDLGFPKEEKNVAALKLVNGDTISGKLLNFGDDVFNFTAKYSPELKIKSQHVSSLTFSRYPTRSENAKTNPNDNAEMVWIPAGEFLMGSTKTELNAFLEKFNFSKDTLERCKDETPRHQVSLDGFWMYRYLVTNRQFSQFVQETGYKTEAEKAGFGWVWNTDEQRWDKAEGANWQHPRGPNTPVPSDHPVVQVSWNDAVAYCRWAGVQLPTEAQWEYACRGGNTGLDGKPRYYFWWGDNAPTEPVGNWLDTTGQRNLKKRWESFPGYDDGYEYTSPVGSFQSNAFGLYDMAGNAWEWCSDWYDANYYSNSPTNNPKGPSSSRLRALRGGGWFDTIIGCRSAFRNWNFPTNGGDFNGFRCVSSP